MVPLGGVHHGSFEIEETLNIGPFPSVEDAGAVDQDVRPVIPDLLRHLVLKRAALDDNLVYRIRG